MRNVGYCDLSGAQKIIFNGLHCMCNNELCYILARTMKKEVMGSDYSGNAWIERGNKKAQ